MTVASCCAQWQHQRLASMRRDLAADIDRYIGKSPENIAMGNGRRRRLSAALTPELICLALYRTAHWLHCRGWRRCAWALSRANTVLHKVHLPPHSCIGPGCRLSHPAGVVFHGSAGRGLTLFGMAVCCADENAFEAALEHAPQLGDEVTLGAHAVVMGAISVGHRTQVSPFTRLDRSVPAETMVVAGALRSRGMRRMRDRAEQCPRCRAPCNARSGCTARGLR